MVGYTIPLQAILTAFSIDIMGLQNSGNWLLEMLFPKKSICFTAINYNVNSKHTTTGITILHPCKIVLTSVWRHMNFEVTSVLLWE